MSDPPGIMSVPHASQLLVDYAGEKSIENGKVLEEYLDPHFSNNLIHEVLCGIWEIKPEMTEDEKQRIAHKLLHEIVQRETSSEKWPDSPFYTHPGVALPLVAFIVVALLGLSIRFAPQWISAILLAALIASVIAAFVAKLRWHKFSATALFGSAGAMQFVAIFQPVQEELNVGGESMLNTEAKQFFLRVASNSDPVSITLVIAAVVIYGLGELSEHFKGKL